LTTSTNGRPPPAEPRILPGCTTLPPMTPRPPIEPSDDHAECKAIKASKAKGKAGDRFRLLNAFVDFTLADLDRGELAVWLVLYRDSRDGVAQVSQVAIARRIGITDRAVRKAIGRLADKGLVKVVRQGRIGKGASAYRIRAIPPEQLRNQLVPAIAGTFESFTAEPIGSSSP